MGLIYATGECIDICIDMATDRWVKMCTGMHICKLFDLCMNSCIGQICATGDGDAPPFESRFAVAMSYAHA